MSSSATLKRRGRPSKSQRGAYNSSGTRPTEQSSEPVKDDYCYICDDGGDVVVCSTCEHACCCDEQSDRQLETPDGWAEQAAQPDPSSNTSHKACVTLPAGFLSDPNKVFQCPECLSKQPERTVNYIINRGSRSTRRVSVRTNLVLVAFYLSSLQDLAQALIMQVTSVLGALDIQVIQHVRKLPMSPKDDFIADVLGSDEPFHLLTIIVTESNPGGGWWWSSHKDRSGIQQTDEANFLSRFTEPLLPLAERAKTARIFPVACATNLAGSKTIESLATALVKPWDSIVLPTAVSLLSVEYMTMLPETMVDLYYYGSLLRSTLLRVWAKSKRVRIHTGLLVIERSQEAERPAITKYEFSSDNSRPWGVDLPMTASLCGCWEKKASWKHVHSKVEFGERFIFLRSTCCRMELHMAIFLGPRRIVQIHGANVAVEEWDRDCGNFTFNRSRMVVMKVSHARSKEERDKIRHNGPWTAAGLELLRSTHPDV